MNLITTNIDGTPDNWAFYFSNQVAYNKPAKQIVHKVPKCVPHCGHHHHGPFDGHFSPDMLYILQQLKPEQLKVIVKLLEQSNLDDLEINNDEELKEYIQQLITEFKTPAKPVKKPASHCCNGTKPAKLPIKTTVDDKVSVLREKCKCKCHKPAHVPGAQLLHPVSPAFSPVYHKAPVAEMCHFVPGHHEHTAVDHCHVHAPMAPKPMHKPMKPMFVSDEIDEETEI